jgi:glyoxylase-like metal-dependent hydrolase (beta-lactamase superfamily II)
MSKYASSGWLRVSRSCSAAAAISACPMAKTPMRSSTTSMRHLTDKILEAIATVSPGPVRFVINTHWHGDHTGGNENLGARGAVIMAHDNVRERMSSEQVMRALGQTVPPSPKEALPVVTFGGGVNLHLNGDTLHIVHVANAHTDGDSMVHWQNANVLHMGDTYFHKVTFPFVDLGSGGSIDGIIAAEQGLEIAGPDKDHSRPRADGDTRGLARLSRHAGRCPRQELEQRQLAVAFPYLHRVALDERVGVLAAQPGLGQRQQHALRMDEAAHPVEVCARIRSG